MLTPIISDDSAVRLVVRHQTIYRYDGGLTRAAMLLRLKPGHHHGQQVLDWTVEVNGEPITHFTPNGYGDLEALWTHQGWVEQVVIIAHGNVLTRDRAGIVSGLEERLPPAIFLRDTPLTAPDAAIRALAHAAQGQGEGTLDRLHALSHSVRDAIDYVPRSTGADTTAAAALAQGTGVCQDHAHVFMAAARVLGIPARYVAGYLLSDEEEGALHETHGWAEAFVPDLGWIGFDPSNRLCVTERYVRLSTGLDAHDAAPIRGSVTSGGQIAVDADVRIVEAREGAVAEQMQQ